MPMLRHVALGALALLLIAAAAGAQPRRDQDDALAARRAHQVMPLREIEGRVVPRMPGFDYLGPEFDMETGIYRLKFMRGESVVWLDVDGRTGQVVARSGR